MVLVAGRGFFFLMGAHSQQIVGRRYSPIQHGRNRVWALPSDPPVQQALCAAAPSSSIKGRERVYSLDSFFEEGLRFSPLSGEKLRIVLSWRVLAATLGSCWKKYMLMTNTAGQGCSAPLQGRGGSTPTPLRTPHEKIRGSVSKELKTGTIFS